jgi:hypothetical protein
MKKAFWWGIATGFVHGVLWTLFIQSLDIPASHTEIPKEAWDTLAKDLSKLVAP